jgi:hypothetical protein
VDHFNVFSSAATPAPVVAALRAVPGITIEVISGTPSDWRELRGRWASGRLTRAFSVTHDPAYSAPNSWSKQLPGMFRYFLNAEVGPPPVEVLAAIRAFRCAVTVKFSEPLGDESGPPPSDPAWAVVHAIATSLDGLIFIPGALVDPAGRLVCGVQAPANPNARLPRPAPPHPLLSAHGALLDPASADHLPRPQVRRESCRRLSAAGFHTPYGLPQNAELALRPAPEIARRVVALRALFMWVSVPAVTDDEVDVLLESNGVFDALTESEAAIVRHPRADVHEAYGHSVGWRLENLWPLAWALGFPDAPGFADGMIQGPTIRSLVGFGPPRGVSANEWIASASTRPLGDLDQLEDLFYCAHHAVRSAQLGSASVPASFHPVFDGGVVHERRHASTWMLSAGVAWDETDLST